jgi:hypothetical protein
LVPVEEGEASRRITFKLFRTASVRSLRVMSERDARGPEEHDQHKKVPL